MNRACAGRYFSRVSRTCRWQIAMRVHAYIRASCFLKCRNFVYIRFRRLSVSTSNPVEAADGAIYLPDRCIQIWIADVAWRLDDAREVGEGRYLFSRAGYSTPSSSTSTSSSSSTFGGTRAISRAPRSSGEIARDGAIDRFTLSRSPLREGERAWTSIVNARRETDRREADDRNFVRSASRDPAVVPWWRRSTPLTSFCHYFRPAGLWAPRASRKRRSVSMRATTASKYAHTKSPCGSFHATLFHARAWMWRPLPARVYYVRLCTLLFYFNDQGSPMSRAINSAPVCREIFINVHTC